jgi:hypothetical protein
MWYCARVSPSTQISDTPLITPPLCRISPARWAIAALTVASDGSGSVEAETRRAQKYGPKVLAMPSRSRDAAPSIDVGAKRLGVLCAEVVAARS